MIIKETDINGLKRLKAVLKVGGISILPSFTIYGFSAFLFDAYANNRIFDIKKRMANSPFIVIADQEYILKSANNINEKKLLFMLENGITVLVKTKLPMPKYASKNGKTAFRVSNTSLLRYLTSFSPITSTSINISGKKEINNIKMIIERYGWRVDVIVNGKVMDVFSTIVELEENSVKIIRKGCCIDKIKEIVQ